MALAPNNLVALDVSPSAIDEAARYGLNMAKMMRIWVESNTPATLAGARTLELGPGLTFAGALGLAAAGAEPAVADHFLSPWRPAYHPRVYQRMVELFEAEGMGAEARVFSREAREGHGAIVREIVGSAEALDVEDGSFDMVFSNAVLEHLADHERVIAELARVTAGGGWNFHQIGYGDHRDFSRPLEHLLIDPAEWRAISESMHEPFGNGCQLRVEDHIDMFERAGFDIAIRQNNEFASDAYLDDFMPRLLASTSP